MSVLKAFFSLLPAKSTTLKVILLDERAIAPRYAHPGDSGLDVFPLESFELLGGERRLIKLGFSLGIPEGYEVQIRPRSGLALVSGVSVLNSPATIDAGYTGEVGVILMNYSQEVFTSIPKRAIAQLVLAPVAQAEIELETDFGDRVYQKLSGAELARSFIDANSVLTSKTNRRGKGAYGSTDAKS